MTTNEAVGTALEAARTAFNNAGGSRGRMPQARETVAWGAALAAAYPHLVGPLLERLDQQTTEIERLSGWRRLWRDRYRNLWEISEQYRAALAAAQARAEAAEELLKEPSGTIAELRDLWQRALEREGNLASAVADVVQKATQFCENDDGDT